MIPLVTDYKAWTHRQLVSDITGPNVFIADHARNLLRARLHLLQCLTTRAHRKKKRHITLHCIEQITACVQKGRQKSRPAGAVVFRDSHFWSRGWAHSSPTRWRTRPNPLNWKHNTSLAYTHTAAQFPLFCPQVTWRIWMWINNTHRRADLRLMGTIASYWFMIRIQHACLNRMLNLWGIQTNVSCSCFSCVSHWLAFTSA